MQVYFGLTQPQPLSESLVGLLQPQPLSASLVGLLQPQPLSVSCDAVVLGGLLQGHLSSAAISNPEKQRREVNKRSFFIFFLFLWKLELSLIPKKNGVPNGIRTHVFAVKGRRPRPG